MLTRDALDAGKRLGRLPPLEGLGVMSWLLQALAADVRPADAAHVGSWLQGFAQHAAVCAEQCRQRQLAGRDPGP